MSNPTPSVMSLRAYAKHRAELGLVGISQTAVSKAVASGRLVRSVVRDSNGDPKIADADLADREWAAATDHSKSPPAVKEAASAPARVGPTAPAPVDASARRPRGTAPHGEQELPDEFLPEAGGGGEVVEPSNLNLARESAREKFWKAHLAEVEYRKRAGELIEVKELEGRLVDVITACKKKLLGIPSRARQQDPTLTAAHLALVEGLVHEALEDLASAAGELVPAPEVSQAAEGGGA